MQKNETQREELNIVSHATPATKGGIKAWRNYVRPLKNQMRGEKKKKTEGKSNG